MLTGLRGAMDQETFDRIVRIIRESADPVQMNALRDCLQELDRAAESQAGVIRHLAGPTRARESRLEDAQVAVDMLLPENRAAAEAARTGTGQSIDRVDRAL